MYLAHIEQPLSLRSNSFRINISFFLKHGVGYHPQRQDFSGVGLNQIHSCRSNFFRERLTLLTDRVSPLVYIANPPVRGNQMQCVPVSSLAAVRPTTSCIPPVLHVASTPPDLPGHAFFVGQLSPARYAAAWCSETPLPTCICGDVRETGLVGSIDERTIMFQR